jgi:hypothetical protein
MIMSNTYSKLNTGDWGVRVAGSKPSEGERVTVTKKDGTAKAEVIGRVLWSGQGVYLCTIAPKGAAPSAPPSGGGFTRRRAWRPCGYPGCRQGQHCDECNGEGAD